MPHYSLNGELKGFQLREQLISIMFLNNECNFAMLRRAIKAVSYMNRLVIEGGKKDFIMVD